MVKKEIMLLEIKKIFKDLCLDYIFFILLFRNYVDFINNNSFNNILV